MKNAGEDLEHKGLGTYDVTAMVTDGYSGEATKSISLGVTTGTPTAVEQMCVTPRRHIFLRETTFAYDYDVWREKE